MPTALLVIDVQRATASGEWAAFDMDRVMERINALIAQARASSTPVVLVQHEEGDGAFRFDAEGRRIFASILKKVTDAQSSAS